MTPMTQAMVVRTADARAEIARAFQDAVIDTLVEKTARAMEQFRTGSGRARRRRGRQRHPGRRIRG